MRIVVGSCEVFDNSDESICIIAVLTRIIRVDHIVRSLSIGERGADL